MKMNYDVFYGNDLNPYGVKDETLLYDIYKKEKKDKIEVYRLKLYIVERTKSWMAPVFKVEFYSTKNGRVLTKAYILFDRPFYVRSVKFDTNEIIASDTLTDQQVDQLIKVLGTIDISNEYSIYRNLVIRSKNYYENLIEHKIPNYKNLKGGGTK